MEPGALSLLLRDNPHPGVTTHQEEEEELDEVASPIRHSDVFPRNRPLASVAGSAMGPPRTNQPLLGPARLATEDGRGNPPAAVADAIPLLHAMLERLRRDEPPLVAGESDFQDIFRPILAGGVQAGHALQGQGAAEGDPAAQAQVSRLGPVQSRKPSSSLQAPMRGVALPQPSINYSVGLPRAEVSSAIQAWQATLQLRIA